jgi:hypothetical protein
MPQTYYTAKPDAEKRFQCRHILPAGSRCACPCLRGEELCYFHHTTRRPVPKWENETPKPLRATFALPAPEDHRAIQHAIGEVLRRIASDDIDPRRAGLLLYGLQIASSNLPKPRPDAPPLEIVEEIVFDADLGLLAPRTEIKEKERVIGPTEQLLRELVVDPKAEELVYISDLEAAAETPCRPPRRTRPHKRTRRTIATGLSSGIVKGTINRSLRRRGKAIKLPPKR